MKIKIDSLDTIHEAAKEYGKTPRGGNNNEILVDDYDRLSGTSCRNGGYTRVSIKKVSSNN